MRPSLRWAIEPEKVIRERIELIIRVHELSRKAKLPNKKRVK
jgi:hypothetical protein